MQRHCGLRGLAALVAVMCSLTAPAAASARSVRQAGASPVRIWTIHYRAHDGLMRPAYVVLPSWYGPGDDPPLPLVISPHGRGVDARVNARVWGDLPAVGSFAVVNPEGQGRRLKLYSWGDPGQISDLAHMPDLVQRAPFRGFTSTGVGSSPSGAAWADRRRSSSSRITRTSSPAQPPSTRPRT